MLKYAPFLTCQENVPLKKYQCLICGFIYDEAEGLPEEGIPAGTRLGRCPRRLVLS